MKRVLACLGAVVLGASTPGLAHADTWALLLGGKGTYANLTEEQMKTAFGGYFAGYDHRVSLPFPGSDDFLYSTKVGADTLYAAVYDPQYAGPKTIGGVSEGAPAVFEVLRRLEADRTAGKVVPPKSQLNVAVYGMPSGPFLGGYTVPKVVSPYDIIIVKAEYDGIADYPDNRLNLLAVVNAVMGADQLHVKQAYFDIRTQPTEYTIVTNAAGGTTTTILIPTAVLPILAPMVKAGASPATIARMDKMLRPIIDSAYKRPTWTVGIPPTLTGPPGTATAGLNAAATVPAGVRTSMTVAETAPSGSTAQKREPAPSAPVVPGPVPSPTGGPVDAPGAEKAGLETAGLETTDTRTAGETTEVTGAADESTDSNPGRSATAVVKRAPRATILSRLAAARNEKATASVRGAANNPSHARPSPTGDAE